MMPITYSRVSSLDGTVETVLRTRLHVECPNCQMQHLMKDFGLTYSMGLIENAAGSPSGNDYMSLPPSEPLLIQERENTASRI